MDREGFRNRLKQYKLAREENPGLKYWEWKDIPKYDEGTDDVGNKKAILTQEEYIAEQIAARKAAALEKSLSRTMPRVPQGIKTGERWNPVTNKVEDIHECGPSCAYTFSDNYGLNWTGSEDFKQNHTNYGWKQVPWEQRQPGDAVLIVDDKGTAKHTMMYDSDNSQGQPLFNHSNGGRDESAIRKKAKYPHHNPYLTYEFVGTPADSTQWINDYKKIYGFADGGEVTGPPTYEQWYTDVTKYNPTILDNASMYWSIEAAKKALHNEAMGLPEYAPMWNNYVRSLPKADPDIEEFVDDLWANENPNNVGYRNGKYYPHKSPEGCKMTIGPGFKLGSGQHKITEKLAKRGMTKSRLDQEVRRVAKGYFRDVDAAINSGQTTNPADTVSPQIKAGLADILHQTGSLKKWPKLINAVREGDLEKIQNEAIVTWRDNNGVLHEDKRRNELRNKKNWHYAEGGEVGDEVVTQIVEPELPESYDSYYTQWQANWLNNRRELLYENMESSKNVAWASNISDAGWKDGSNNRSYLSNFSLAPLLKGMSPNRVWVNKEYYRQLNNAASAPEAFIPQFSGTSGAYIPGDHKIEYDPFLEEKQLRSTKMHERTHSSNPRPQEYKIRKITKWSENEKGYGPGMRYFKDPREIYARLMQYRHDNGLLPTDVITKEYLENHRQLLKDNWLHIFTDEELLDIFNNVAENRMDEKNTHKSMRA